VERRRICTLKINNVHLHQQKKENSMGQENTLNFMHIDNVEFVSMDITLGKVRIMVTVTDNIGRTNVLVMNEDIVNEINLKTQERLFEYIHQQNKQNNG